MVSVNVSCVGKCQDTNINSGCGRSMTTHKHDLTNPLPKCVNFRLANNFVIKSTHVGIMSRPITVSHSHEILLVPNLHEPLLLVFQLCGDGTTIFFASNGCHISTVPYLGHPAGVGERRSNLFYLPSGVGALSVSLTPSTRSNDDSLLTWHNCLGHNCLKPWKKFLKLFNLSSTLFNEIKVQQCPTRVQSKIHHIRFLSCSAHRSKGKGELIPCNLCSFHKRSCEGFKYWVTFIDAYSKESAMYPLKYKDQSFPSFIQLHALFKNIW